MAHEKAENSATSRLADKGKKKNRPMLGGGYRVKKHLREKIHHIYMLRMKSHNKERNGRYDRVLNT